MSTTQERRPRRRPRTLTQRVLDRHVANKLINELFGREYADWHFRGRRAR